LHSSFASAVTGKTPLWGMHLDESRLGKVIVDVEVDMELIRASFPFLAVVIVALLIVMYVPFLGLFIPNLSGFR